jgi:geranylgeranyl reductase family protein
MFDCIIVGAGPAGGSAAYHLAKRGRSVLILEKDALPRYKPCSGGVAPIVGQWFDFDFSPAISCKVNQIRYTWKMGDPIDAKLPPDTEPMWMVQRDVFDHFLIQKAQEKGAELRDNTAVTGIQFQGDHWQVNTANGPVQGRYLVAADGAKGPMAEWLGFKPRKLRMAEVMEISNSQDSTVYFEMGLVKNGSLWAFPKANGYTIGAATLRGGEPKDFQDCLSEYASFLGLGNGQYHSHPIALWDGNQPLHTQQAVLVGEAACMLDPLSAEGIRPAMFSGIKASEAIDQALAGNANALEQYTETIHQEWGTDMQWAQRIAGMFYRVPGIGYRVGLKRPTATKRMAQLLTGELRYADIANKVMKRLSGSLIPGFGK